MEHTFKITENMLTVAKDLPYEEAVPFLVALTLIEKYGITPAILERWGKNVDDHVVLRIPTSKTIIKENKDDFLTRINYQTIQIHLSEL